MATAIPIPRIPIPPAAAGTYESGTEVSSAAAGISEPEAGASEAEIQVSPPDTAVSAAIDWAPAVLREVIRMRDPGLVAFVLVLAVAVPGLLAQTPAPPEPVLSFEDYEPRSTLVVPEHPVTRARFPFVDVHNHQEEAPEMTPEQVDALVKKMDALNMAVMVNLSGGSGELFRKGLANLGRASS